MKQNFAEVFVISNDISSDLPFFECLSQKVPMKIISEQLSYKQYSALLKNFDLIISNRLHTTILSIVSRQFFKLLNIVNYSSTRRECNVCGWNGFNFLPYGVGIKHRREAQCPKCKSFERHRAVKFLLNDDLKPESYDQSTHDTLHVAPEVQISDWLQSISDSYLSIDLFNPAMEKMDLTSLKLSDESKTLVFCSHVLEHIVDDLKAISEIFRVLKPGGIAIIQVPIWQGKTYEDFSITSKAGRLKAFLQEDHVRLYGLDFKNV